MKICSSIITFLLIFLMFPSVVHAKIWINEFSSTTSSDWIELYNDGDETVNLDQFKIRDNTNNNKLTLSGEIEAKGYEVFEWGSKLNNGGDTIRLVPVSDENAIIDQVKYGSGGDMALPSAGQFGGRQPDGASSWMIFATDTKGAANSGAQIVPTVTPIPQNTPTSKPQPTPTRIPTPTRTPTPSKPSPTPKISVTVTPKVTSSVTLVKVSPAVLGTSTKASPAPTSGFNVDMGNELVTPEPMDTLMGNQEVRVKNAQTSPLGLMIGGGVFMVVCGILMAFRKKIWKRNA